MKDTVSQMRMRKATITELASRIPEKHFEDLKEALAMHDRDRTGFMDAEKFLKCLHLVNMNGT